MAVPAPELFKPYQISMAEWLPPELPRTHVTPPPLTPVTDTLLLAENNTSAPPGCGAALKLATTLLAKPYVAVFC